ncbi:MAG: hypothetical protein K9G13_00830 [Aquiluna sp.]|nr:hypothetical protein [Aquiluna sp.]MCF8545079.1 hypothetical protein [Aquiluna sp.]
MTRELIGFLMILLVLVVANLIWFSVLRRKKAQEKLLPAFQAPKQAQGLDALYVATVFADRLLDRVWAHGIGMRGKASLGIDETGISVHRKGEVSFLIPSSSLTETKSSQATIDKGVESDGLEVIAWLHNGIALETSLRFADPSVRQEFHKNLQKMIGATLG